MTTAINKEYNGPFKLKMAHRDNLSKRVVISCDAVDKCISKEIGKKLCFTVSLPGKGDFLLQQIRIVREERLLHSEFNRRVVGSADVEGERNAFEFHLNTEEGVGEAYLRRHSEFR